eukprot:scaffold27173_cov66-Skeletonema_marinoi.AAC.1
MVILWKNAMQPTKFCATGLAMWRCLLFFGIEGFLDSQAYQRAKERAKERMQKRAIPQCDRGRKRARFKIPNLPKIIIIFILRQKKQLQRKPQQPWH